MGFDEALKQVVLLYAHLDVSSCGYFKEIQGRKLVDKLPPRVDAAKGSQGKASSEDRVDDSLAFT